MAFVMKNLFELPDYLPDDEVTEILLQNKNIRVERILSSGQSSPPGFWYDQKEEEYVVILKGCAELLMDTQKITLREGDSLLIPAHQKHRVESTSNPCVWLCIFITNSH